MFHEYMVPSAGSPGASTRAYSGMRAWRRALLYGIWVSPLAIVKKFTSPVQIITADKFLSIFPFPSSTTRAAERPGLAPTHSSSSFQYVRCGTILVLIDFYVCCAPAAHPDRRRR